MPRCRLTWRERRVLALHCERRACPEIVWAVIAHQCLVKRATATSTRETDSSIMIRRAPLLQASAQLPTLGLPLGHVVGHEGIGVAVPKPMR